MCIFTFIIAMFIVFIIGSTISPYQITQTQDLEYTTKSPTQSQDNNVIVMHPNSNINQNTQIQTPSLTTTTTNKPTTTTTTSTTTTSNTTSSTTTISLLPTNLKNEQLSKLETIIQSIVVNGKHGMNVERMDPVYGPVVIHYKYPSNPIQRYSPNEIRRTCFKYKFLQTSIFENAIIKIKFNRFKLENGFDRVLIRHFNESFIDSPLSYTGYQYNLSIDYLLERGTNKSICIELQSDETITDYGIDFDISVYYDLCQWSPYNQCYTMQLWGQRWNRGPFMNGQCGLGITSKYRLNTTININNINLDGLLANCDKTKTSRTEYCIKRKCEDYNNYNDTQFDYTKAPGQGWFNLSRYYNGAGRLDPNYADPFRIYLATKNNLFDDYNDAKWIERLENKLTRKAKEISDEHQHVNILKYAILDPKHRHIAAEFIGAKVIDSLVNGKPFIAALSGDSVTSGHDNMFMNTYPMQLQSRLRKFFVETGNVGSTFLTRNFAVGGGPMSDSQGFMPVSMITETFPDGFSELDEILDDNYDIWYRNGYPIRKLDLVTFEYYFVEGGDMFSSRELHVRESAYLGAVWAVINPIRGIKIENSCTPWQELNKTMHMMTDWMKWDKKWKFINDNYLQAMGIIAIDPNNGMPGSCPLYKQGTVNMNTSFWHHGFGEDGLIPDGQMVAYSPSWLMVNWHPNSRGHRVMSDVISFWIINSAVEFVKKYKNVMAGFQDIDALNTFLKQKSGTWKKDILKSMIHKKYDEWVDTQYCGSSNISEQYNDYCESIPFALTNAQPTVYNTHNLLNEYVYDSDGNGIVWKDYIKHAGWTWATTDSIVSIMRKEGTEGNMDIFWYLKPDTDFFVNKFREMYKNKKDNIDLSHQLDGFHDYLIKNKIYLQFVVKIPKYGSGRIKIFNGFHCNDYIQRIHLIKVYVNKLENMKGNTDELQLGKQINSHVCIINDLELDTKYVVTYVPYNITAKSAGRFKPGFAQYFIMFLVGY